MLTFLSYRLRGVVDAPEVSASLLYCLDVSLIHHRLVIYCRLAAQGRYTPNRACDYNPLDGLLVLLS